LKFYGGVKTSVIFFCFLCVCLKFNEKALGKTPWTTLFLFFFVSMYALYMFQTVHWMWIKKASGKNELARMIVFPFLRVLHPIFLATVPFLACYRLDRSIDLDAWYMVIPFAVGVVLYVCLVVCFYRPKNSPFYDLWVRLHYDGDPKVIRFYWFDFICIVMTMVLACFKLSANDPIHLWVYVAIPELVCFGFWFATAACGSFSSNSPQDSMKCEPGFFDTHAILCILVYAANFAALLVLAMQIDKHAAHAARWFIPMVLLVPVNAFLYSKLDQESLATSKSPRGQGVITRVALTPHHNNN
jgi:hypothetical protein